MSYWTVDSGVGRPGMTDADFSDGPLVGLGGEALEAGFDSQAGRKTTSRTEALRPWYRKLRGALNEGRPPDNQLYDPHLPYPGDTAELSGAYINPGAESELLRAWEERERSEPGFSGRHDLPDSRESLNSEVGKALAAIEAQSAEIFSRTTLGGKAAFFAGAAGALVTDPVLALSLPFGAGAGAGLTRTIVLEGLVGGVSEAAVQPSVFAFRNEVGLDYSVTDALSAVAYGTVGGAAFGGTLKGVIMGVERIAPLLRPSPTKDALDAALAAGDAPAAARAVLEMPDAELAAAAQAAGRPQSGSSPDGSSAGRPVPGLQRLEKELEYESGNPYPDTPEGRAEYDRRMADALGAVVDNDARAPDILSSNDPRIGESQTSVTIDGKTVTVTRAPDLTRAPRPASPISGSSPDGSSEARIEAGAAAPARIAPPEGATLEYFRAGDLTVDAARMQFKAATDAEGVGEALLGVEKFDPVLGGDLLVWRDRTGRDFVADGHQRVALARRLEAQGQPPAVLKGYVLLEADGVTAAQARAIAAGKNIAAGSGTVVDAAKVLRNADAGSLTLPPRSDLVRQARALAALSDDGFDMVVNGVVPGHMAALVGRLAPDLDTHAALLDLLGRAEPANLVEAEAMLRQALQAGFARETQSNLFGEQVITKSLVRERAKILDQVLKSLRQEGKLFAALVREESRISGAGNVLAHDANIKRAQTDAIASGLIQKLAHRSGPVADALNAAAREAAASGNFAAASGRVASAIREAVASGDLHGLSVGRTGGGADAGGAPRSEPPAPHSGASPDGSSAGEGAGGAASPDEDLKLFDAPLEAKSGSSPDGSSLSGAQAQTQALLARQADLTGGDPRMLVERQLPNGDVVEVSLSRAEMLAEIEADNKFLDLLDGCN